MPDRALVDAVPGELPRHEDVQQLVEAESGRGTQGVLRTWQASDSSRAVLVSDAGGVRISRDNGTTAPAQVVVDGTAAGGALAGTYPSPTLAPATVDGLIPPGTVWPFAGGTAPPGWLLCNGGTVSRAAFPKLFAVIGTTYNTGGEPGTDFRLPNLVGRVVLGVAPSHALGQTGGAETTPGPAHTHTGATHTHDLAGHTHAGDAHTHDLAGHAHASATHSHDLASHTHTGAAHVHASAGHAHASAGHSHVSAGHIHGLAGHGHDVDITHGHNGVASGGTGPTALFTVAALGFRTVGDTHDHAITVGNATGSVPSGVPTVSTNTTATTPGDTGSTTPAATSPTTPADTGPTTPGAGAGPVPTATLDYTPAGTGPASPAGTGPVAPSGPTGAPSGPLTLGTDGATNGATYSGSVATMQPYLSLTYIIWPGA